MKMLLVAAHWFLTHKADKIEAEFRFGPYPPGTYGAEMIRFADGLLPDAPKEPSRR